MKLYLPIIVDLYNIYPLSIMNVQQYNIGRGALVTLTAAGQVVVPNKESLYVYTKKKDGKIAYATCTLSGNQIKIDYDEQMTAIVGTMTVELQMVDENGNSITTPIFQVNIQPSNIDYKKVTSSDEFLALVDALNNVNSFQNQINELNEKLGTKKVFKTYFVGSDKSLWNVFKEILSSSDSFSTIIFNQPQENVFSEKGLESGVLTVYYSVSYWANHLMYCLQAGTSVYTGIINAKDNQIMSFAQQITKDYVDDRIKIIESAEITLNTSTTISYTLYSLPAPSGYRVVSREFIRLDDGTYNVLISLLQNRDYIVHMSTGAHTIKGKVLGLCVKS